jgi:hypothetical protein
MFNRKFVLSAGLLAILMYGISSTTAAAGNTVIYISALDCPNCARFDASYLERFTAAMQAKGYAVRRVVVAHFNDIRDQSYWPSDLKPLLRNSEVKEARRAFLSCMAAGWSRISLPDQVGGLWQEFHDAAGHPTANHSLHLANNCRWRDTLG